MQTTNRTAVVGVFENHAQAQQAVQELRRAGFQESQIAVIAREEDGKVQEARTTEKGSKVAEGAGVGVAAGAGIGALYGLGIAMLGLPAIGPVLVGGGLLASVLASAVTGAVAAGIVGALVGLGIPEEEAKYYENEVKGGRVLVTVKANGRSDEANAILRRFGAYDINTKGVARAIPVTGPQAAPVTGPQAIPVTGQQSFARTSQSFAHGTPATPGTSHAASAHLETEKTIPVREEELHAHKQPVNAGEVRVHKEVVTEHKTLNVPVEREEVVIERRPASGQPTSTSDIRPGEEIRIPVKEEQVHVDKQAVVKEEVKVGKRTVQDTEQVSGTVRKEKVQVNRQGDVDVQGNVPTNPPSGTTKNPRK